MSDTPIDLPAFARNAVNLASGGLGARAVFATDEFFAPLERMLKDEPAVFIADKYDDNGKWMDGWESRRRRDGGHDYAVIALAAPGRIDGFDVDTSNFTGNYALAVRIEACLCDTDPGDDDAWTEILPARPLGPSEHHYFACDSKANWSHLRVHMLPDGGIARLKVFGPPRPDPAVQSGAELDPPAAPNRGRIIAFSNAHFGAYHRLLAPGRGRDMGDGWETRRLREPGNDWIVIELAARGTIHAATVDTAFFKGNFPDSCSIQAGDLGDFGADMEQAVVTSSMFWETLLPQQKLTADAVHQFGNGEVAELGPVTHVRLNIFPDGGVSRLKLFGKLA